MISASPAPDQVEQFASMNEANTQRNLMIRSLRKQSSDRNA